ncbi:TMEM43 family protein [Mangrovivirga sp. M17]|uniref:TMEM43 family protein n=1 Tax=Mangrovivirga halotolerans TaxID=2993936 RepID=A0ABT3RUL7_9BACT|nr:TMEM43 family protein [Mangrovivirga halotolerans]MCX2745472.1 TMEM43 family protein [Mangrovivirga halotolerans]
MENQDSFREVSTESWGSRIMGSIKKVLFGVLLFLASFIVLWLNEGRAVRTAEGLTEGASQVVSINSNDLSDNNAGKLVHLTGKVVTNDTLKDNEFNVQSNALKLRRRVSMYQWVEKTKTKKEKEIGGSEKTTKEYTYSKDWKESIENSNNFKVTEGHTNPQSFPYAGYTHSVPDATMGSFDVSGSLLSKMNNYQPYPINSLDTTQHKNARLINEGSDGVLAQKIYIGQGTPSSPQIGDIKISFETVQSGEEYSIVSKQIGNTFEPFQSSNGTNIQLVSAGVHSADQMFASAQKKNTIITWLLRLLGFFLMFVGISLVFKPLVVLADVLPILGNIVDFGLSLFAGLTALSLSIITIAIAWIFYRPILGVSLLVVGVGITAFLMFRKSKVRTATA